MIYNLLLLLQRFYLLRKDVLFVSDPTLCYWSGWVVLWSPWTLSITIQTVLVLTDPHRRLHHSLSVLWWIHALKNWYVDQRWFNVYGVGSTLSQRLINVSCLVGCVWRQSTDFNSKRGTNRNDLVFWLCSFLDALIRNQLKTSDVILRCSAKPKCIITFKAINT